MSLGLTYLITGASRGIGKGLAASLLQRPNTTVIAAVRDLEKSAPELNALPRATGSKLLLIKIDSQSDFDAKNAISQLQSEHGISAIDTVIANAGIAHSGGPVAESSGDAIRDHFNTNTVGPMLLFSAVKPLLQANIDSNPKFVAISTILGSIGAQESLSGLPAVISPYGASKAALNWVVRRIHYEEPWLTAFTIHPGLVLTDMGMGLSNFGVDIAALGAVSTDVSVGNLLKVIDSASREFSGSFRNHDGTLLPW